MLARELSIVLRSRLVWLQAAMSALLVGHGFILAVDIYAAGSRSVRGNELMAREFDPLLGIVRPTLGSLYFAVSILGPLVAARGLAVEKERRTYHALILHTASPLRVAAAKWSAAIVAVELQIFAPLALLLLWVTSGGHLHFGETAVAISAHVLYMVLVASLALAAAAWTDTLAQAATLGILVVAASWAIDASEGFAALAWLGRALDWSVTTHLSPLEQGMLAVGGAYWMLAIAAGAFALAYMGMRFDLSRSRRALLAVATVASFIAIAAQAQNVRRAYDVTEEKRLSLPPAVVRALPDLPGPIRITVNLDRDDARRRQLDSSVLSRLRLARSDVDVEYPTDSRAAPAEAERDDAYGKIVVQSGGGSRETYSTSRREILTLVFEASGRELPYWKESDYSGYPLVVDGNRRTALSVSAYAILPGTFLLVGWFVTRPDSRRRSR
jgi:hypothetical protein